MGWACTRWQQQNVTADDFAIQLQDGDLLNFRLTTESTVADVINLINNHPDNGGLLHGRVWRRSATVLNWFRQKLANAFQVQVKNGSQAAIDLGLVAVGQIKSATAVTGVGSDSITGRDVNPGETDGLFNSLARLHNALRGNDPQA